MASKNSIITTRNYRLFKISDKNRELDPGKHRDLKVSMEKRGFLRSWPIVCARDGNGSLVLMDGQHRLFFAEEFGIPVSYIVEEAEFDIAEINSTPRPWVMKNYAAMFGKEGIKDYEEGLKFAEHHKIPIGTAFALLAGVVSFSSIKKDFIIGKFRIKDLEWSSSVASIYAAMLNISSELRRATFLAACMAVVLVDDFDPNRLLKGAKRCRDRLVSYATRDCNLDMIEYIYNYGRTYIVPLKIPAIQALRKRNPAFNRDVSRAKKS